MKIRLISANAAQETRNDQFPIRRINLQPYAVCTAGPNYISKGSCDMKDLGDARRILGMEIQRDRKMASHFKLSSHECPKSEEDKEDMSRVSYSSAVGSLMYAMVCTRPDLAHALVFVFASYHSFVNHRGRIYLFSEGVKEVIWLRGMVNEFDLPQEVLVVYCDNRTNYISKGSCDMKDLGNARRILGMEIQRDRKMVANVPTPLASHFKLSSHECPKFEEDKEDMSRVSYSSAVGSLMYAMVCTRPDLAHAVSVVSRYMHNPGKMHWEAVKCIIRYLQRTSNIGLYIEKGRASPNEVVGYVDFDYAGVKEAIWLRGMVNEFDLPQEVLVVYSDNRSAMHLTKNNKFHSKTKHIEVRHHFV
nr:retrovirus-related Pol polyprotein from transposon TNT 1-94 [Tanacetum cinerariifolium]